MFRKLSITIAIFAFSCANVSAQDWAKKMFTVTSHDFGTVARGSKTVFRFEIQNKYEEDLHISGVRTSCGCTTPSIENATLKTWEKGAIVAKFNTNSFLGSKDATITVTIDKPFRAEVQLSVKGTIRGDVVLTPGLIQLGNVEQGETATSKVHIAYAGKSNWQIVDVRSANPALAVELVQTNRSAGRAGYDLVVRLKEGAPVGFIQGPLTIVTNDSYNPNISLAIEGKINSAVTVSPAALSLGELTVGETVQKKIIVRAKKPFKITSIKCEDKCFEFGDLPKEAKKLHFLPVTFTAGEKPGKITGKIVIETDIANGASGSTTATALVKGA
ncbi:MAG: hypothetical protein COA78_26400 [Blastopirellula sp.]|nr:MAG: hypothetical protein COA78_26400 [Blastopirellula sp.]